MTDHLAMPPGPFTTGQQRRLAALLEHAKTLGIEPHEWGEHIRLALADHDEWAMPQGTFDPYDVIVCTDPHGIDWGSTDEGVTWKRRPGRRLPRPYVGAHSMSRITIAPHRAATVQYLQRKYEAGD